MVVSAGESFITTGSGSLKRFSTLSKLTATLFLIASSMDTAMADTIAFKLAPDLAVEGLSITYTASTGEFRAEGYAISFTAMVSGSPEFYGIGDGQVTIAAQINSLGVMTSGSLSVTGCVAGMAGQPGCGSGSSLLTSSEYSHFEFVNGLTDGEILFAFINMTGDLAPFYDTPAYVKMNLYGFPGTFESNFSTNDFANVADIRLAEANVNAAPEPGTWAMLACGAGLFAVSSRKLTRTSKQRSTE